MKKLVKTVVLYLRPLTPEEKKQAGIISAHEYRTEGQLKSLGR
jgi:hypothetical protein